MYLIINELHLFTTIDRSPIMENIFQKKAYSGKYTLNLW